MVSGLNALLNKEEKIFYIKWLDGGMTFLYFHRKIPLFELCSGFLLGGETFVFCVDKKRRKRRTNNHIFIKLQKALSLSFQLFNINAEIRPVFSFKLTNVPNIYIVNFN